MTDDELRMLVREAIARHMAGVAPGRLADLPPRDRGPEPRPSLDQPRPGSPHPSLHGLAANPAATSLGAPAVVIAHAPGGVAIAAGPGATVQVHISHAAFALPPACDGGHDGPCATEPDAACNSCGFCQSYGH